MRRLSFPNVIAIFFLCCPVVFGQDAPTSIDFYGLRKVTVEDIETAIGVKGGQPLKFNKTTIKQKLIELPQVADAEVSQIRYPGNLAVFIGIREEGQAVARLREKPKGSEKLSEKHLQLYDDTMSLIFAAISSGNARDDHSEGHSISSYKPMAEKQRAMIPVANGEFEDLSRILRKSSDPKSRKAAAFIIAYHDDKKLVIEQLMFAANDPDSGVRNNAVRALAVIAQYATENPDKKLAVDPTPFLQLLSSLRWTDRNKGAAAVDSISAARDPKFLKTLRDEKLKELVEMASWKSAGHAFFSIRILARISGLKDDQIMARAKQLKTHSARVEWVRELVARIEAGQDFHRKPIRQTSTCRGSADR